MEGMMRVSVVATGIDATEVHSDIPVPRRSMAAPLKPTVTAEEKQPEPMEEVAPAAAARVEAEEPSLFEGLDAQRAAAEEQMEDIFEDEAPAVAEDDLPPPAYRPQVAEFQPRAMDEYEDEAEAFVAPKAPAPGTPSPEAMARLRAAVGRAPIEERAAAPAPAPEARATEGDKPRFGINSLINRMTGHGEGQPQPQQPRQQPPVRSQQAHPQPREEADPDQERIEIPAFLRRQAN
jgi:cell division protein FtsZ